MGIEVKGDSHTVAGRDIIQLGVGPNREPLTDSQRRRLNALVVEVSEDLKVEPRQLWTEIVHVRLGVKSVVEITRDQFGLAEQALCDFRLQRRNELGDNRLISEILRQRTLKGMIKLVDAYCLHTFGEGRLKSLNRQQLLQLLAFVDHYEAPQATAASDPTPSESSHSVESTTSSPLPKALPILPLCITATISLCLGIGLGAYLF